MQRISERVYWLPPAPPDRPSLCAVAGDRRTLMLDGGSSAAHARLALEGLAAEGVSPPSYVAITHSHWDHVFGAAEFDAPLIAHALTAETLVELAATDWSDEALDRRVAGGEVSAAHAEHVKEELPAPREVRVAPADIVISDGLDVELGGARVHIRHVGGDHAADSCVMYVDPDRVLFLGDCLYDSPDGALTADAAVPLYDTIRAFGAHLYVDGHSEAPIPPADLEAEREKMLLAERFVREAASDGRPDEAAVVARIAEHEGREPDEDLRLYVHAFVLGHSPRS
ncbi:MAG TPA: MBL fold metallo-hydrolase [Gaiellaceae bacterium]|nr:MBL fold metallo-hydrolase [Gaiellaceae bacterium]